MSRNRPRLVLHIGQHKTGTKALQSFLACHVHHLEQRGILYPLEPEAHRNASRAYANSHFHLYALLRREVAAACGEQGASATEEGRDPHGSVRGLFESLEAERSRTGAGTLVLSAEDLFDMRTAHELAFSMEWVDRGAGLLARLVEAFDYDPLIAVYLRRQDHLLAAHYGQFIKGDPRNEETFDRFAEAFGPRLRTHDILLRWAQAFGPGSILARPYEPSAMPGGIVPSFFQEVLGLQVPPGWNPPPDDQESVNASLDRDQIEFIRILNRRTRRGLPTYPRQDVLEAVRSGDRDPSQAAGIASWLSPAARRTLLEVHEEGNAGLAERFRGMAGTPFFAETPPGGDEAWQAYPGLTADRAVELIHAVHETASRRRSQKRRKARRRKIWILLLAAAAVLAGLWGVWRPAQP